jgi:hypothetical protein
MDGSQIKMILEPPPVRGPTERHSESGSGQRREEVGELERTKTGRGERVGTIGAVGNEQRRNDLRMWSTMSITG